MALRANTYEAKGRHVLTLDKLCGLGRTQVCLTHTVGLR